MLSPKEDPLRVKSENVSNETSNFKTCPNCGKNFSCSSSFNKHIKAVHDKIKRLCETCDKIFTRQDTLKRHIEFVHEGHKYICNYCQELYPERRKLLEHSNKEHPGEEIIYEKIKIDPTERGHDKDRDGGCCEECDRRFSRKINLKRHIRVVHKGEVFYKPKRWFCNKCDKKFNIEKSLKLHIEIIHEKALKEEPVIQERKKNLLKLINKKVPEPCPHCGREFSREDTLVRHIAFTHEGQVFECNFCSMCFKDKRYLVKHIAGNHTSENLDGWMKTKVEQLQQKPETVSYKLRSKYCPHCGKHFQKKLAQHIRFVHGEKTLSCEHCDAKFVREDHLRRHIKVIHLYEQFQCDFCKFRGTEKRIVVAHAKRAHPLNDLAKMKVEIVKGEQPLTKISRSMHNNDAILERFKLLLDK